MWLLRFFQNLETSRSRSWPFLFLSLVFCSICYSCYFCYICYSIFSLSKENSSYLCDSCDICYFFIYTFLIAVSFKSLLLTFRKQFASKFLLTRSILDISGDVLNLFTKQEKFFLLVRFLRHLLFLHLYFSDSSFL